jgi:hypothetical protein
VRPFFNFHHRLFSLRSSSRCLPLILLLSILSFLQ